MEEVQTSDHDVCTIIGDLFAGLREDSARQESWLEDTYQNFNTVCDQLTNRELEFAVQLERLQEQQDALAQEYADLASQREAFAAERAAFDERQTAWQRDCDGQRSAAEDETRNAAQLQEQIAALEAQLDEAHAELIAARRQETLLTSESQSQLVALRAECESLQAQLTEAQQAQSSREAESERAAESLREQIEAVKKELTTGGRSALEAAEDRQEIIALRSECNDLRTALTTLRTREKSVQEAHKNDADALRALRTEVDLLRGQLESAVAGEAGQQVAGEKAKRTTAKEKGGVLGSLQAQFERLRNERAQRLGNQ